MTDIIDDMIEAGATALSIAKGKNPKDFCTHDKLKTYLPFYMDCKKEAEACLRAALKKLPDIEECHDEHERWDNSKELYQQLKEWAEK